jgi:lamin tail-like protein
MKKLLALLTVLGALTAVASASGSGAGSIVVSQLFAAGGNTGAPYANDYVELFNRGASTVSIAGWTLQYTSATGTVWASTPLSGSVPAGGHYLVQLASGGTNGSALPTPDATGTSNLAMSGGKVQIVNAGSTVEDLVGWGSATLFEGTAAAPALSATTALVRGGSSCTDADDNSSDFTTGTPNPGNSSAALAPCSSGSGGGGGGTGGGGTVGVDLQPVISVAVDHDTLDFGSVMPGATPDPLTEHVTVTSTDSSGYTLTVNRSAFTPHDLPLGIGVGSNALAAVPIAPDPDLLLGTTTSVSATAGDVWTTNVGFVSPLPPLPSGHYTATLTYTVIAG